MIPQGHKFACIAVQGASVNLPEGPLRITEDISIHLRPPFSVDSWWKDLLGSDREKRLSKSNFLILVTRPSIVPGVLNQENEELKNIALYILYSVILQGLPDNDGGLLLTGAKDKDEVKVRQVARIIDIICSDWLRSYMIEDRNIRNALPSAYNFAYIYERTDIYRRIKRGIHAWIRAISEKLLEERLHQSVRLLDAIIKLKRTEGLKSFAKRCCWLTGISEGTAFEQIYELRSGAEHMNDYESYLDGVPTMDRSKTACFRSTQAELLASAALERIISRKSLLAHFESEDSIETFWKMPDNERSSIWGDPINLDFLMKTRWKE
jgi:hypothetical protein